MVVIQMFFAPKISVKWRKNELCKKTIKIINLHKIEFFRFLKTVKTKDLKTQKSTPG